MAQPSTGLKPKRVIISQVRLDPEFHHKMKMKLVQDQVTFQDLVSEFLKSYVTANKKRA
jgi:hypothetical protein